ncbi:MAG: hypothetical protein ACLFV6_13680 [Spirulinaceae cyanobacterium]
MSPLIHENLLKLDRLSQEAFINIAIEHLKQIDYQVKGYWHQGKYYGNILILDRRLNIDLDSYSIRKNFQKDKKKYEIELVFLLKYNRESSVFDKLILILDENFQLIAEYWDINPQSSLIAGDKNNRGEFPAKVEITSFPVAKTGLDETEYLLQSEANRKKLLQAIENVNHRENLVEVQLDNDESF